jgi:hypothetical protein
MNHLQFSRWVRVIRTAGAQEQAADGCAVLWTALDVLFVVSRPLDYVWSSKLHVSTVRAIEKHIAATVLAEEYGMPPGIANLALQNRFFVVVITIRTKHVLWFSRACLVLQGVSELAGVDFRKLVLLFLEAPGFYVGDPLLKLTYTLQQRGLFRLGTERTRLGAKNDLPECDSLGMERRNVSEAHGRVRELVGSLQTGDRTLN